MFVLNLGSKWPLASTDDLRGIVLLPSLNSVQRVARERPGDFHHVLLDPQLYLAGMVAEHRTKACARLAGFPWFGVKGLPAFDSATDKRREWEKSVKAKVASVWPGKVPNAPEEACRQALEFQQAVGVTSFIIPTPLLAEREDEASTMGEWIDAGLAAADEMDLAQPLLASVAVSENALNDSAFEGGGALEAVVDQVCARGKLAGVYIVVVQTRSHTHPFENSPNVTRAYLHLTSGFSQAGVGQIVVNFADLAGACCVALGATLFATGASSNQRLVNIEGFKDEGGGIALPWYYSHKSGAEYLTDQHLGPLVKHKLFHRVEDETVASAPLNEVLRAGGSAASVAVWAESQNNYGMAYQHFIQRMVEWGTGLRQSKPRERFQLVADWLENGEASALYLAARLKAKDEKPVGRRAPLQAWRELLELYQA